MIYLIVSPFLSLGICTRVRGSLIQLILGTNISSLQDLSQAGYSSLTAAVLPSPSLSMGSGGSVDNLCLGEEASTDSNVHIQIGMLAITYSKIESV